VTKLPQNYDSGASNVIWAPDSRWLAFSLSDGPRVTPIKYSADEKIPPFAAIGTEKLGDESLLHIRFIAPDKITYEGDRANYWIAMQNPQAPMIHRFLGPMGFENKMSEKEVEKREKEQ
jgi:hypothetical protein